MASFSHYASKFLNQSQPIFYSVQGDDHPAHDDNSSPFHDHRDRRRAHAEEYDPFNLEEIADQDEDDVDNDRHYHNEEEVLDGRTGGNDVRDSLPLLLQSQSKWRQHISPSPPHSPASSASSSTGSPPMNLDLLLEESLPPSAVSQPSRTATQHTLTESLLPRSATADTFSLPVVGRTPRRKFHDLPWAYTWFVALGICALGSIITLFIVSEPPKPRTPLLYSTLTHTIPLLVLFTLIAAILSYLHLLFLRVSVQPVLMGTSVAVPTIMLFAATYAFAASFFWTGKESGWAETIGLRLFALVPLALAALSARELYNRRSLLNQTISVVTLTTRLLLQPFHLPLLALSPILLFISLLISLPFLSLVFHLLLIGYFSKNTGSQEWHLRPYAGWLTVGTLLVWFWTWCVARDILRVCVSGVIGSWYFNGVPTDGIEIAQRAIYRALGPSLGTECLSALVLTAIDVATFLITAAMRITLPPAIAPFAAFLATPTHWTMKNMSTLSNYALVYTGVTGMPFFASARRARALTSARGMRKKTGYRLLTLLLILSAFSMGLIAAVGAYIFTAYTLGRPAHAPFASFLGGVVTFLVGWFCLSLVDDVADTLYMCYCIDVDRGAMHKPEVFDAFEDRPSTTRPNDSRV